MKTFYLFLLLLVCFIGYAQPNCDEANAYLVNAYSHVKDAYDSNNISHLKYYADRSLKSFKLSKNTLGDCGCDKALTLANKSIDLLAKVDGVTTYEDGRFFVKQARELSKESVIEIDKCSVAEYTEPIETQAEVSILSDLEKEQLKLKQQQEALKQKEEEIKAKLAEQQEQELSLKKKQLIQSYKNAIALNVKTYNSTLDICNCKHEVLTVNSSTETLETESLEAIKNHFNHAIKTLASNYMAQLELCETR
ncbi:hypothetical protein [Aestuariivivens sp. NBU2969]|uniref:hypothetical protein n=1 Tax=Aestuariivivens sp. NBU2969 TaxID=2873267 RepID=UPI001CBDA0DF|nr:hypothetical protein [Aestuariivivens sp. NBU2969]